MVTLALSPAPARTIAQRWVAPASLPVYRLLAIMFAAIALLVAALDFTVDREVFTLVGGTLAFAAVSAMAVRSIGGGRLGTAVEAAAIAMASGMLTCCLVTLLAAIAVPFRDEALALADRVVSPGLTWRQAFTALRHHDLAMAGLSRAYASLLWQPFVLVMLLAAVGREAVVWRYLHAWLLTMIVCVIGFALVPALGPYPYYHLLPADVPGLSVHISWRSQEVLAALRSGGLRTLTPAEMTGIVTFPSFHAAAATLLAWGYRQVPWVGGAFVLLDVAMALSAPLVGGHYFVDIAAGIAVAIVAIGATGAPSAAAPRADPSSR